LYFSSVQATLLSRKDSRELILFFYRRRQLKLMFWKIINIDPLWTTC